MSGVLIAKYNLMCRITMVSSRQERWIFDKIKTSHNIAPETDNEKSDHEFTVFVQDSI
jgi:hypothetical protein